MNDNKQKPEKSTQDVVCPAERCVIREPLKNFTEQMELKLRKNDHKGGWTNCDIRYLINRLRSELLELDYAIRLDDNRMIVDEAVDVANFAMMIADNHRV